MKLHEKIAPALRAIEFITRHDDELLALRREAAARIKEHLDAELAAAEAREKKAIAAAIELIRARGRKG